jgi:hypothetical protein
VQESRFGSLELARGYVSCLARQGDQTAPLHTVGEIPASPDLSISVSKVVVKSHRISFLMKYVLRRCVRTAYVYVSR